MKWVWLVLASLALLVLQLTIANQLSIGGVHVELVWVLPIAAGLVAGPMPGMAAGFVAGVVFDLFLVTPFGLTALVGVLIGYTLGRLGEEGVGDLGGAAFWVAPFLALCAGAVAPLAYAVLGAVSGHRGYLTVNLAMLCLLDAVACALLVRPTMRALSPALSKESPRSSSLESVRGVL
jgi:rod shape-determining protein MreD